MDYKSQKAAQRKIGQKALWVLIVLLIVVVFMVVKLMFANNLSFDKVYSGLPSSDQAYIVAKEMIRPTLKSSSANFSDSHYQFAKKSDSVYVIQSSVDTRDRNNEKITVQFKIIMKYNGGEPEKAKNWELVNLDTN